MQFFVTTAPTPCERRWEQQRQPCATLGRRMPNSLPISARGSWRMAALRPTPFCSPDVAGVLSDACTAAAAAACAGLDGKHTIFGRVCGGMDVIKRLDNVQVGSCCCRWLVLGTWLRLRVLLCLGINCLAAPATCPGLPAAASMRAAGGYPHAPAAARMPSVPLSLLQTDKTDRPLSEVKILRARPLE